MNADALRPPRLLFLRRLSAGAVALLAAALVAGFLGPLHPAFDSFAHSRVHLAVLITLAAMPLLASRRWQQGLVAWALAALAIGSALRPAPFDAAGRAAFETPDVAARVHTLLSANLLYDNARPDAFVALVKERQPDILALSEVSDMWADRLRGLLNLYPYQLRCGRGRTTGGTAVFSRFPFAAGRFGDCSEDGGLAVAPLSVDGQDIHVAALHLHWPWPRDQAAQIGLLAPRLAALPPRAIVAGDINATPWSFAARRLAAEGALKAMPSRGPTWLFPWMPSALRPLIGLPIDNAYVKDGIVLYAGRRLAPIGSDHLPLWIEFGVRADAGAPGPVLTASAR